MQHKNYPRGLYIHHGIISLQGENPMFNLAIVRDGCSRNANAPFQPEGLRSPEWFSCNRAFRGEPSASSIQF
ncbi:hypothetical protein IQ268_06375 [Oculatella sp. LEGE 06141]|uniref:hypothetical protein n=1 Tax=Oculatella sp. LEGE 06141 TaxID=1828648 RepID=UPI0018801392|nr:hypothetical protein [Oculatella sp. LEGE 06141]MBE9178210.1 hypothetical protein [Oculatella sp. LEGE 06141]